MILKYWLISLVLSLAAVAETVPVIATITETNEDVIGKHALPVSRQEGTLYRASDGSTLRQFQDRGELTTPLKHYEINYRTQRILELPHPPKGIDDYKRINSLGEDVVAGIRCKVIAVEAQGPTDDMPQRVGTACVSDEYGLMLRQETRYHRSDDDTVVHSVVELSNVQLHTEPDAGVFQAAKDFAQAHLSH